MVGCVTSSLHDYCRTTPDKFMEDDTLHRLISLLLNEKNKIKSDKVMKSFTFVPPSMMAGQCMCCLAQITILSLRGQKQLIDYCCGSQGRMAIIHSIH